jgi:purine nucleosidase
MHRVIIDTDVGIDDAHALLMALKSPDISVEGITTVFGNTQVEHVTRNVLYILDLLGMREIPVMQGASKPILGRDYKFGTIVHGDKGLGAFEVPDSFEADPKNDNAIIWMVNTVMNAPGEIEILVLGPQTNIALATLIEPNFTQAVKRVVFMGGIISGPGNVRPLSTANINNDAEAAHIVFHAGYPIVMVGQDVTRYIRMLPSHWIRLRDGNTDVTQFLEKISKFYMHKYDEFEPTRDGHPFHDMAVIAFLLRPDLFKTEKIYVTVEMNGHVTRGQTVADRRERSTEIPQMDVCIEADANPIYDLFIDTIIG